MGRPASLATPLLALAAWCTRVQFSQGCTTIAVGRDASVDGSVLVAHSDDGHGDSDSRLCYVPAQTWPEGSDRPVYFSPESYPRFVGNGRGECYLAIDGQQDFEPIGFIPQVEHTFAYYEGTYGIMNEKQVAIAESTCSGVFGTKPINQGGSALLSVDQLTYIAMERASSAREAIEIIGALAEAYGFYGPGSIEGSAESLFVGDPEEVWVFHILPDPTGLSAIWAAQRVPSDHVSIVANMFIIREIDFEDADNFMWSESVRFVAFEQGWWNEGEPLDFTKLYSEGEYAHKFYSGRRVWGAYRLFGNDFPDEYGDLRYDAVYPVSAKPTEQLKYRDIFAVYRNYYEGTKYDLTQGIAAGPWNDPDRWQTQTELPGAWERSIGLFRTTYVHVVQSKRTPGGSVLWFSPHSSAASVFFPLTIAAKQVPAPYYLGQPLAYHNRSTYWAHRYVFNVAKIKYSYAMELVRAAQVEMEDRGDELANWVDGTGDVDLIQSTNMAFADAILQRWNDLMHSIIQTFADGYDSNGVTMSYPDWWLSTVGYENGPPPPPAMSPSTGRLLGHVGRKHCDDAGIKKCITNCSSDGFALCATACSRNCRDVLDANI